MKCKTCSQEMNDIPFKAPIKTGYMCLNPSCPKYGTKQTEKTKAEDKIL